MRVYLIAVGLLLFMPLVDAYDEKGATATADDFVLNSGVFYHRASVLQEIDIFRKVFEIDEESISFLYEARTRLKGEEIKGQFILRVDKKSLEITSLKVLKKKKIENSDYMPLL